MDVTTGETYQDSVEFILELLKTAMGIQNYTFFDGDPDLIAKHELPAIAVEMVRDDTGGGTWGEDDVVDTVLIKLILNKSDDWTNERDDTNLTHRKVRKLISARKLDGQYLDNTIKGALRREIYSDDGRIGSDMSVDYGFLERPEAVFTSEGHITVTVKYPVVVPPPQN